MCGGRGWQLVVEQPLPVDMEAIPDEVYRSLPGLALLTDIHLEPISAPESARKIAIKVANAIARPDHGAVLDEQEGALTVPRGVTRTERSRATPSSS